MSDAHEHDEKKHSAVGHGLGGGHGGGHEEHEGAPEWLISFADNVTLMMGFFVVMLAVNMKPATSGAGQSKDPGYGQPTSEMLDTAIAIREAFHNPVDPASSNPIDLPLIQRLLERSEESQAERDGQVGREHDVRSIRPSDYFSKAGIVTFERDAKTVSASGQDELAKIAQLVRGYNVIIELRGHASAVESHDQPDRGMQLSNERAMTVAKALADTGVEWRNMRLIGCADSDRLVGRAYDTPGHRANQRVEVIITNQVVKEDLQIEDTRESREH